MALVFAGSKAYLLGNVAGPYAITAATNDQVSIAIDGGSNQVFTLTAGAARTAAQIVADLSALTGATASVITIGTSTYVQIKTTSSAGNSSTILVNAPTHHANTTLGLIATTYKGGVPTDGATSTGTFTGTTKQNVIDGLEAALLDAGWITISGHGTTTLVMQCSITPEADGSLIGVVRVKGTNTNCVSISIENISGSKTGTNSTAGGFMLLPGTGKVFRVLANKHQFFIFTSATTTAREFACAGVPYIPTPLQGASGIYECIWGHGNGNSDTDTTGRPSFRTVLTTHYDGTNTPGNMAMIYNGSLGEVATNVFTPGGANNFFTAAQRLRVFVIAGIGNDFASNKFVGPDWPDGSSDLIDAIICFGVTSGSDNAVCRGQLYNAAILMKATAADITDTFNSHNWWFLTSNNSGSGAGGSMNMPGTLIIATT